MKGLIRPEGLVKGENKTPKGEKKLLKVELIKMRPDYSMRLLTYMQSEAYQGQNMVWSMKEVTALLAMHQNVESLWTSGNYPNICK